MSGGVSDPSAARNDSYPTPFQMSATARPSSPKSSRRHTCNAFLGGCCSPNGHGGATENQGTIALVDSVMIGIFPFMFLLNSARSLSINFLNAALASFSSLSMSPSQASEASVGA